jgi:phosphoglycolate phosphatase
LDTLFSAIICGDSGFGRKPAPAPLQAACQRLGADPAATMMVGDSVTDVRTARAANCTAVIVRGGYTLAPVESFGADAVIASIADVARLLEA